MKPRITVITLGVDDLQRSLRFYRDGLGLKTEGIIGTEFEHGAVVFFDREGGLKLALFPRWRKKSRSLLKTCLSGTKGGRTWQTKSPPTITFTGIISKQVR
ncbi:VOC family protein [Nostoc sp. CHAB 5715]|uniref:VOC family protein n=1 Tax=Nostoc sp. CHAB 5715 TaxID=2780400 RepID=UPI001E51F010|nr:VOC family protein [Nostoc sp. CHAB 5715]